MSVVLKIHVWFSFQTVTCPHHLHTQSATCSCPLLSYITWYHYVCQDMLNISVQSSDITSKLLHHLHKVHMLFFKSLEWNDHKCSKAHYSSLTNCHYIKAQNSQETVWYSTEVTITPKDWKYVSFRWYDCTCSAVLTHMWNQKGPLHCR